MSHVTEAYKDALEGKPRCGEGCPWVWGGVHTVLPGPGEWQKCRHGLGAKWRAQSFSAAFLPSMLAEEASAPHYAAKWWPCCCTPASPLPPMPAIAFTPMLVLLFAGACPCPGPTCCSLAAASARMTPRTRVGHVSSFRSTCFTRTTAMSSTGEATSCTGASWQGAFGAGRRFKVHRSLMRISLALGFKGVGLAGLQDWVLRQG